MNNIATWQAASLIPILGRCDFEVTALDFPFLRGDANDDGNIDLSDAIKILLCKFVGEPCPECRDAMDANDDGRDDVSDAITILTFLFRGGNAPPTPGPEICGLDPTPDDLPDCEYLSCLDPG